MQKFFILILSAIMSNIAFANTDNAISNNETLVSEVAIEETLDLKTKLEKPKPLMVVRLNREKVFYKKALGKVTSKAVNIKNDVQFYLDVYVKKTGDEKQDQISKTYAHEMSYQIGVEMLAHGADQNNIIFNYYDKNDIPSSEIHIFVK